MDQIQQKKKKNEELLKFKMSKEERKGKWESIRNIL